MYSQILHATGKSRLPVKKASARENRLLSALPSKDRNRLLALCEPVDLEFSETLYRSGDRIERVYFPIDSLISLVTPIDGQPALEVGMIGNEGMLGITLMLGVNDSPLHALVQGAGRALRMDKASFRRELGICVSLQRRLNRYLYVLLSQFAQTAACTRFHVVEARLARWLLMTRDRTHADVLHLTHEFLAYMLGVRRVGITEAATSLQNLGLIHYSRGDITIVDRIGLEKVACSCYAADKQSYERNLG